jgi:hypothetical protein
VRNNEIVRPFGELSWAWLGTDRTGANLVELLFVRGFIVSLQKDWLYCKVCGIMFSLGNHNRIPQKRCNEGCYSAKPRNGS